MREIGKMCLKIGKYLYTCMYSALSIFISSLSGASIWPVRCCLLTLLLLLLLLLLLPLLCLLSSRS